MMPEEAAEQTRVFMSTASSAVWFEDAQAVQGNLALLANTLVKYQPVAIYVSPSDVAYMQSQLASNVTIVEFQAAELDVVTEWSGSYKSYDARKVIYILYVINYM